MMIFFDALCCVSLRKSGRWLPVPKNARFYSLLIKKLWQFVKKSIILSFLKD